MLTGLISFAGGGFHRILYSIQASRFAWRMLSSSTSRKRIMRKVRRHTGPEFVVTMWRNMTPLVSDLVLLLEFGICPMASQMLY